MKQAKKQKRFNDYSFPDRRKGASELKEFIPVKEGLHTQGEWKFDGLECILSESGEIIADIRSCNHDGEELENQVFNRSQDEAIANAELIVKAVNEYEILKEARNVLCQLVKDKENERKALLDSQKELKTALSNLLGDVLNLLDKNDSIKLGTMGTIHIVQAQEALKNSI